MNILVPMAGLGSRFKNEGYEVPKPLIKINGNYMFINSLNFLETNKNNFFFIYNIFLDKYNLKEIINSNFPNSKLITINFTTKGQASTCLLAKNYIKKDEDLLITPCDSSIIFSNSKFVKLKEECDVIIFVFRNNLCVINHPEQYGWVKVDKNNNVTDLSIKKKISTDPLKDYAIVGTFWYKYSNLFFDSAEKLVKEGIKINNEFYVDESCRYLIANYKVKIFEVDYYVCWGTPNDLKKYNYWYEFFSGIKQ